MTTQPPPEWLERKVHQLDNDVQAIYGMIARVEETQSSHTTRFDEVDTRFDGIDSRLDAVDMRFDGIDTRLDGVDAKLDEVLRRLEP